MAGRDSMHPEVLEIETLIRNYINNAGSNAGIELSKKSISGYILLDVLDNLGFETDKEMEEYKNARANYEQLTKDYDILEQKYKKLEEDYETNSNKLEGLEKIASFIRGVVKEELKKY